MTHDPTAVSEAVLSEASQSDAALRSVLPLDLALVDLVAAALIGLSDRDRSDGTDAPRSDGDWLAHLRSAAVGAVAARHLALGTVETAGVIGTGIQARLQMRAAYLVRPFRRLLVHGRDPAKAAACAADLGRDLDTEVEVMTSAGELVREAQLVVTTTRSSFPVVRAAWLHPGLHITAVGADRPGKTEIAPDVLASADLYACDGIGQCATHGEMAAATQAGITLDRAPVELGGIVAGSVPGRETQEAITLCDLTGAAAIDRVLARHARDRLARGGAINAA